MFQKFMAEAAEAAGLQISDNQLQQFTRYYELLIEWNEKMNLTAITEPQEVAVKHMVDSLTALETELFAEGVTVIDVGTGAGFLAILLAAVVGLIVQPDLIRHISGQDGLLASYKGIMQVCYGSTNIETGVPMLNELVHTSGMAGMMPTIWLIICAQTFGGALTATGQLQDLMRIVLRWVRGAASLVASTVGTAIFCNIAMADQYLSIMLSSSMFKDTYREKGYEPRLLSRSCEDGATVTSVLVPWNTCGLTQSTVLGVATLTYLPYCFFNYLSPLMSIFIASIGWKIKRAVVPMNKE